MLSSTRSVYRGRILPPGQASRARVTPFTYPAARGLGESPAANARPDLAGQPDVNPGEMDWATTNPNQDDVSVYTEQEVSAKAEKAWKAGFEEGKKEASKETESQILAMRAAVAATLKDFAGERELYYQRVEGEVVALAVAIARRILHREAQLDPLLLSAAVRVALERLAGGTRVKLRVHPDHARKWYKALGQNEGQKVQAEVIADRQVSPLDCLLECELGTTTVSIDSQLKEIEAGFFDLLKARPAKV